MPIRSLAIWVAVIFVGYCWLGGTLLRPISCQFRGFITVMADLSFEPS